MKHPLYTLLPVLFWLATLPSAAQSDSVATISTRHSAAYASTNWEELLDELQEDGQLDVADRELYNEHLATLAAQPLDLNTASKEDLEQLPFLSAQQIEDILAHIYQYQGLKSLGELHLIRSLDDLQCRLMSCFCTVSQLPAPTPTFRQLLRWGHHEIVATAQVPFYQRQGDNNGYLGYRYKHWIRYSFSSGQWLRFGLLGAQDAGEPFLSNRNHWGYDYYSFWFQLRQKGWLKNLTLGRYRLHFGLGLVLNNDFGLGKVATLATLGRSTNDIKPHASRYSANYLQGGAATIGLGRKLQATLFVSWRQLDATLNKDSRHTVATILTNGYHRTSTEIEKKNNLAQLLTGAHIGWQAHGLHAGATAYYTHFDRELHPNTSQLFRRWQATGQHFYNMSIDYGYMNSRISFYGETATGNSHAIATINTLSWNAANNLSIMALQRFYSYRYYSFFAHSFSEGGSIQDESGLYMGIHWVVSRHLSMSAYTDAAHFAWPKYGHTKASKAWDNWLTATWTSGRCMLSTRYRLHLKDIETHSTSTETLPSTAFKAEHRGRLAFLYKAGYLSSKTQADLCLSEYKKRSFGYMMSQNTTLQHKWLQATATLAYFHTQDYNSRLYTYEPGALYQLSFPMFYGHGIRYMVKIKADIGHHLMCMAKLGTSDFFDRDHISSGYQRIDHSHQTDLDLQLRWKF